MSSEHAFGDGGGLSACVVVLVVVKVGLSVETRSVQHNTSIVAILVTVVTVPILFLRQNASGYSRTPAKNLKLLAFCSYKMQCGTIIIHIKAHHRLNFTLAIF